MDWFTGKMVLAFTQLHIMLLYTYMHIGLCVYYIYIVYACPSSMLTLDRAGGSLKATLSLQFTVCRLDAVLTSTEVIFFQWWLTSQIRQGADVISILLISHDEERDVRWVFGLGVGSHLDEPGTAAFWNHILRPAQLKMVWNNLRTELQVCTVMWLLG